jgi:hypothetical protein
MGCGTMRSGSPDPTHDLHRRGGVLSATAVVATQEQQQPRKRRNLRPRPLSGIILVVFVLQLWSMPGRAVEIDWVIDQRTHDASGRYSVILCSEEGVHGAGHAFAVWASEDPLECFSSASAYGFHPVEVGLHNAVETVFGSVPGEIRDEWVVGGDIRYVLEVQVDAATFHQTLRIAERWNDTRYSLVSSDCATFISEVAEAMGLETPPRWLSPTPHQLVRTLAETNGGVRAPSPTPARTAHVPPTPAWTTTPFATGGVISAAPAGEGIIETHPSFLDDCSDSDNWIPWGSPAGYLDTSVGNPAPSLKGNGDGWYGSGLITDACFDISDGAVLEFDFMQTSGLRAGGGGFEILESHATTGPTSYLNALLGVGGKQTEGGSSVDMVVVRRDRHGDLSSIPIDSNNYGRWVRVRIEVLPGFSEARVYIDGALKHTSTDVFEQDCVWLAGYGHDPSFWYDNWSLTLGQ